MSTPERAQELSKFSRTNLKVLSVTSKESKLYSPDRIDL
jgi:hypothetical protein